MNEFKKFLWNGNIILNKNKMNKTLILIIEEWLKITKKYLFINILFQKVYILTFPEEYEVEVHS